MDVKREATFRADVWIAGDVSTARLVRREYCLTVGLCVTLEPCDFIYTGGMESGVRVGLLNYPRFPTGPDHVRAHAFELAKLLMIRLQQTSVLIADDKETVWLTRRDDLPAVK